MNKPIKKLICLLALAVAAMPIVSCGSEPTHNEAPEITGVHDIDCGVNESIDLLYHVAALDKEDGDITPKMDIDIFPSVSVVNGVARFDSEGVYEVTYFVEDSDGKTAETFMYVTAYARTEYRRFLGGNGFFVNASGGAELTEEFVTDGKYIVDVQGAQKPSDAMLSRVFELKPDREYTVSYTLKANSMGTVRIFVDGNETALKQIEENRESTFSFDFRTAKTENDDDGYAQPDDEEEFVETQIDVQLGSLGKNFRLELSEVSIGTDGTYDEFGDFVFTDQNTFARFDGAQGTVSRDGGERVTLDVTSTCSDIWGGGVFINAGIALNAGDTCAVSFDTEALADAPYEIVLQNQQWDEYKYGTIALNGSDNVRDYEFVVPQGCGGELWIYIQSGTALNTITMRNINIKLRKNELQVFAFDKFNTDRHPDLGGDGYVRVENSTVVYTAVSFGSVDWHNRLDSSSFSVDGSVDKFIISFKAKASRPIKTVFCAPSVDSWDPNLLYSEFTIGQEEQYYFFTTDTIKGEGEHMLVWQFGSVENQKYNNVVIEISDITIYYCHGLLDYSNIN